MRLFRHSGRGLDHQAWTKHGYPAVSIVEGDQAEGGWLPFPHTGAWNASCHLIDHLSIRVGGLHIADAVSDGPDHDTPLDRRVQLRGALPSRCAPRQDVSLTCD